MPANPHHPGTGIAVAAGDRASEKQRHVTRDFPIAASRFRNVSPDKETERDFRLIDSGGNLIAPLFVLLFIVVSLFRFPT